MIKMMKVTMRLSVRFGSNSKIENFQNFFIDQIILTSNLENKIEKKFTMK